MSYPIYLDYAATTPVDERVLEKMLPYFTQNFGNAGSRQHAYGWLAAAAVANARIEVANLIGGSEKEIVFTSGATESINLALKGVMVAANQKNHLITVSTEHKATLEVCQALENQGIDITYLSVNVNGEIDLSELESSIKPFTSLISILHGNNETGIVFPVNKIAEIAHSHNVLLHVDGTQSVGKIPVLVNELGVDLLSFSSHKIYGPKGVGALFIKKGTSVITQQQGGGQERNLRGGTHNVPGIVGFGEACKIADENLLVDNERITLLRNLFETQLREKLPEIQINCISADRLPHISNVSFQNVDGEELLMRLNEIAVSNGSACTSATTEPSHVLKAMGLSDELAYATVRFSFGKYTTVEDIHTAVNHIATVYESMLS